jgi:nucleoid-associated protein YgaU
MAYLDLHLSRSPRRHRIFVPAIFLFSSAFLGATLAHSQDVAEAARQERARKEAAQKKSKHVYTNEDLKHSVILTPDDQDEVQAKKNQIGSPADKPADASAGSIDAQSAPAQIPLGDVARANRKQRLLQQKLQPQQSAQFHLPNLNAPLASPKPPVFPSAKAPSNSLVIIRPPQRPSLNFDPAVHPKKRSPFERNFAPASPSIRPSFKAPAVPTLSSAPEPASRSFATVAPAPRKKTFTAAPALPAIAPKTLAVSPVVSTVAPKAPVAPAAPLAIAPKASVAPNSGLAVAPRILPAQPAVPVAPKVSAPVASSVRTITVRRGDSLWKLAQQNLGQGLRWHDLVVANPNVSNPNRIAIGSRVLVPSISPVVSSSSNSAFKIKVRSGDTLWTLARTHFGRASSWSCIAQANPLLSNPDRIFPGQELLLPATCSNPLR